jgi:hypothetical protein
MDKNDVFYLIVTDRSYVFLSYKYEYRLPATVLLMWISFALLSY